MFPFILIWGSCFLIYLSRNRNHNLFYSWAFFVSVIVGYRYYVGADWVAYKDIYYDEIMKFNSIGDVFQVEPGFLLIGYLCSLLNLPHGPFLTVLCFIELYFLFKASEYYCGKRFCWLALLVYISMFFCAFNLNIIRHGLMACTYWYATMYLNQKRYKYYIIYGLVATSFHTLGLLFLVIGPILCINYRKIHLALVIISSFIIVLLGLSAKIYSYIPIIGMLEHKMEYYTGDYYNNDYALSAGIIVNMLIYSFWVYYRNDRYVEDVKIRFLINSMIFSFFVSCFLSAFSIFVERISGALNIATCFGLVCIYKDLHSEKARYIIYVVLIIYLLMYFYRTTHTPDPFSLKEFQYLPFDIQL